jgi:branched-chain amino acid transport system substrate-binding protein
LAKAVVEKAAGGKFAFVSCTDHDSRVFATELLAALDKIKAYPARRLEFLPDEADFGTQLDILRDAAPAVVVLIAGPHESAGFLVAMREAGLAAAVFGGPAMGRRLFVDAAGEAAEGVVFPMLWYPSSAGRRSATFAVQFRERFGMDPDYTAAHTYDGMTLLVAAIRKAGLNRARIRDALRMLSPFHGVTGRIAWDPTGHNNRPAQLGTISHRHILPR